VERYVRSPNPISTIATGSSAVSLRIRTKRGVQVEHAHRRSHGGGRSEFTVYVGVEVLKGVNSRWTRAK